MCLDVLTVCMSAYLCLVQVEAEAGLRFPGTVGCEPPCGSSGRVSSVPIWQASSFQPETGSVFLFFFESGSF